MHAHNQFSLLSLRDTVSLFNRPRIFYKLLKITKEAKQKIVKFVNKNNKFTSTINLT